MIADSEKRKFKPRAKEWKAAKSELKRDRTNIMALLCKEWGSGLIDDETFVECVLIQATQYDSLTRSTVLARVEATIRRHFCRLWDNCIDVCEFEDHKRWIEYARDWNAYRPLLVSSPVSIIASQFWQTGRPFHAVKACVLIRDDYRCQACGYQGSALELDHITPLANGGNNSWRNLWILCKRCNRKKQTKSLEEFFEEIGT